MCSYFNLKERSVPFVYFALDLEDSVACFPMAPMAMDAHTFLCVFQSFF